MEKEKDEGLICLQQTDPNEAFYEVLETAGATHDEIMHIRLLDVAFGIASDRYLE